ncbi:MAG: hypothetical protein KDA69_07520 [Planctomycetaceae bacterium]|nr:hypothetical protein [Planctomycetaceae bacterium]MCA9030033.1 hypothetical protein [Planctomycetaceae bacterium]MCA9044150.1 hypothetical protein [Planctomycetaceae bacterium]MCB9950137.1 hypothetical protein [Planctomycetaceae bacterium]
MDTTQAWRSFFENWPSELPQNGIIITTFQESIPFVRFLIGEGTIAIERDRPDTIGARKVIIGFNAISAVKMTDTDDFSRFLQMGFSEPGF